MGPSRRSRGVQLTVEMSSKIKGKGQGDKAQSGSLRLIGLRGVTLDSSWNVFAQEMFLN